MFAIVFTSYGQSRYESSIAVVKKQKETFKAIKATNTASVAKSISAVEDTLYNDGGLSTAIGAGGGDLAVFTEFQAADLAPFIGKEGLEIKIGLNDAAEITALEILVYTDTNIVGGAMPIHYQTVPTWVDGWNTYVLAPSFTIDGTPLFVGYNVTYNAGGYPAGCDAGPVNIQGNWLYYGGWAHLNDLSASLTGNWNIRLNVGSALTCPQPYDVAASNITTTSADIAWTTGGAAAWNLQYGVSGFVLGAGTTIVATNPKTLTGLTQNTDYDVYVQDDCGGEQSAWSFVYTFTTAADCPVPSALNVTNITPSSCDLGWTTGGAEFWNVEYGVAGFTLGTGTNELALSNPWPVAGLVAGNYEFYVQDFCGTGTSDWVGPFAFTIPNCLPADQCEYVFDLRDSYGDGWNNATLTVTESGVAVATIELADGSAGQQLVALCDAKAIEVIYNKGDWDSEVGFTITDPFGTELYTIDDCDAITEGQVVSSFTSACTPPTCAAPTALAATTTQTTASLSWTIGDVETAWNVAYDEAGFDIGTATPVAVTATTYPVSGLTAGTAYEFYVQADCGGDVSAWVGPFAFSTPCADVTAFPYTEDFEDAAAWQACWSNMTGTLADGTDMADGGSWFAVDSTSFTNQGADYIYSGLGSVGIGYSAPDFQWLVSPSIVIPATPAYDLKFWLHTESSVADSWISLFYVKVYADGVWTEEFAHTDGTNNLFETQVVVDLTAYANKTVKLGFVFEYNDGYELSLDDVVVDQVVGVNNTTSESIRIYPNPTNGMVNITNANNSTINVYNMIGEVVATVNATDNFNTIDLSNLSQGSYIVKVVAGDNVITKKINLMK